MPLQLSRRGFLYSLLAAGCSPTPVASPPIDGACGTTPTILGRIPFVDEGDQKLDTIVGQGLDGRLYTDLEGLTPDALVIPNERFYVRTRQPDQIDLTDPWRIHVGGKVTRELDLAIADIVARARPMPTTLLECSGNAKGGSFGLMSAARWTGVPLAEILSSIESPPDATRVLVDGFDKHLQPSAQSIPGASWIFTRAQIEETGAFLATSMNDAPLPADHGFPVRLVVPGWYGCTCIKWVDAIQLVGEDEPATTHMREFASRTQQDGQPALARDFRAASIDLAAMPVRIERVSTLKGERLFITGIYWGGDRPDATLELVVGETTQPVQICTARESRLTWGLWTCLLDVPSPGKHDIVLRSADPQVRTRRLDNGYYTRSFIVA